MDHCFLIATADALIMSILGLASAMVAVCLAMKYLQQPYIVGYIIAGALLGKQGLGFVTDHESAKHLGEIGIILLLFFIGMEISLPKLIKRWKIAILGTLLQVVFSVAIMWGVGLIFGWGINRIVVLGFIIALSSSAIVIKLLEDRKLLNSELGQDVLSILLMQDIVIVPLLIICSFLGGSEVDTFSILKMFLGGLVFLSALTYIYVKQTIKLPLADKLEGDQEMQVFAALAFCFGGALLASVFSLSPALGAFVGGMVMHSAQSTRWIHGTLHSFRVLFVAVFFTSIGLQLDLAFLARHAAAIGTTLLAVYVVNHVLNMLVLRMFNESWRDSFLGGAFLSQIGELSFLLASAGQSFGIINEYSYQFTISLISLTLVASPFWVAISYRVVKTPATRQRDAALPCSSSPIRKAA